MHPTCLNGKVWENYPLCLISLPLCFLPVSLGVPQKRKAEGKQLLSRRTQHHVCTRPKDGEALTSTIQTRSTVNPGTPHRRAALLANTSVPIVSRKEVADSRLSPGVSAGRSETAPGITAVTRSAGDTLPQGFPPHRLSLVVRLCRGVKRKPEPYASGGSNFRNHPLGKPRLLHTGVTFGKTSPKNVP